MADFEILTRKQVTVIPSVLSSIFGTFVQGLPTITVDGDLGMPDGGAFNGQSPNLFFDTSAGVTY